MNPTTEIDTGETAAFVAVTIPTSELIEDILATDYFEWFWSVSRTERGPDWLVVEVEDPESYTDEPPAAITKYIGAWELTKALNLMRAKAPKHFGEVMTKCSDMNSIDVLLQYAIFGKEVYG